MTAAPPTKRSSPLLIAGAWLVVLLPIAWGLSYTVRNAVNIFARADVTASAVPSGSTAPSSTPAK